MSKLQRFDEWVGEKLSGGSTASLPRFRDFEADYAAAFGAQPFDRSRAIRIFVQNEYAKPAFLVYIVAGGVVSMVACGMLCLAIPARARAGPRSACAPYTANSLVAHVGRAGLSFLASPTAYAIGTGMLGATLFKDARQNEGVFETFKYLRSGKNEDADASYAGKAHVVLGGIVFAIVCMGAGATDWNFANPVNPDAAATTGCRDDAGDSARSSQPTAPTVGALLTSDVSLLVAVVLNFLGDSLMVGECFEYGRLSDGSQIIKILADNAILVVALSMRARQKNADAATLARYLGALSAIYVVFLAIGYAVKHSGIDHDKLKAFCAGFVPVVLVWTLLLELAPNTTVFTDDAGFEIPREMRLSTTMTYTDDVGRSARIQPSQCMWFNQRELVVSLVTVAVFYAFSAR